jgi:uncharacterized protein YjbI with pentapeptide repeats
VSTVGQQGYGLDIRRPRYNQAQMEQFISAHERFLRREPRARRAVMRFILAPGLDFSRRVLVEADFTGADLRKCRFALADLERAALYCADMRAIDARGANFHRADLRGVSLRHANLTGARLDGADMREAVLARVDVQGGFQLAGRSGGVTGADGENRFAVDFTNCSMKNAQLGQARLKGANFTGALLQGADLKGASLEGARFDGAVLTGADFAQARIDPGALSNCVVDPSAAAVQRTAELAERLAAAARWIATNGAEGHPANLDGEDLRTLGTVFERACLTALSARTARAIGVSFKGAQLQGAHFDGADLREADFGGADLRGASFRGANLRHARFDGADIRPLAVAGGVRLVDLEGADHGEDAFAASRRA